MAAADAMFNKIVKEPLRTAIRQRLVDSLFDGNLEPGQRLNERDLADQLGISRTPLREALIGLEYEGLVEPRETKGFRVATLRAETAKELCGIVAVLESEALRQFWSTGGVPGELLDELDELTRERAASETPGRSIELDGRWHRKLTEGCENGELLQLIEFVRTRLYFYEYIYVKKMGEIETSIQQHLGITDALRGGEIEEALELLRDHWKTGVRTMGVWLDESEDGD